MSDKELKELVASLAMLVKKSLQLLKRANSQKELYRLLKRSKIKKYPPYKKIKSANQTSQ